MAFHRAEFLIFFAVVLPITVWLLTTRYTNAWLLAASRHLVRGAIRPIS